MQASVPHTVSDHEIEPLSPIATIIAKEFGYFHPHPAGCNVHNLVVLGNTKNSKPYKCKEPTGDELE